MVKKVYHISGFNCANCAAKTERHLNSKEYIESAKIDFATNKMYISYKEKAISIDELNKVIDEVEDDPLELYEEGVIKKTYHISGFDCANCALKTEKHLNSKEKINEAKIDFATNKMYITYSGDCCSVDELLGIIQEVESDPLELREEITSQKTKEKPVIFTKNMWFILARTIVATIITAICVFLLGKIEYNWLRFGLYAAAFLIVGYDVVWKVILHIKHRANFFDHNLLISLAAIGAFTLCAIQFTNLDKYGEHIIHTFNNGYSIAMDRAMDAMMVIILFQIGRIIEGVATNKSKAAVMKAVELRVDTANLITNDGVRVVSPEELNIGDKILIKVGELIPVDGEVIDGEAMVDTSSLTGEFVPVRAFSGEQVYSGCLIKQGQITVLVKKKYVDSAVSKIIQMITSGGEKKSKADEFIAKFGRVYTPVVFLTSILAMVVLGLITKDWMNAVYEGLEVLVTGCPCAIVISVPLAYFAAIGLASKHGIVVKGSVFFDKLYGLKTLITDKTGTLTKGSFSIQHVITFGVKEEYLLERLKAVESFSNHPIAKAINNEQKDNKNTAKVANFKEIAGFGVEADYEKKHIVAGSSKMLKERKIEHELSKEVGTVIYVAEDNKCIGYVVLSDEVKESAERMVSLLHKQGVETVLLTGDHEDNARDIATRLGVDRYHSQLLPEEKTVYLEQEMKGEKVVAFAGDGINDAPSIIRSDVGIAMGAIGSDIAVENADVVIMNDDPLKIYDVVRISRIARHTAVFNIIFSLIVKVSIAVLVMIQDFIPGLMIPMYVAVIADTGLTVIMVINSLLVLYRKIRHQEEFRINILLRDRMNSTR